MSLRFSNFGKAVVTSAPTGTTGLAFTVAAGKGSLFPALGAGDYFYGLFKDASGNHEVVRVSARSTDSMTIATGGRGLDGTSARTWAAGDLFVAGLTNIALQESVSNPNLTALGTLAPSADKIAYFTGADSAALTTLSAFARTLIDDASTSAMLTTLGFSTYIQTLLNDSDAATARATLGALGAGDVLGGTSQIWRNMTSSRAVNTNYTNSTGRPIVVSASVRSTHAGAVAFLSVGSLRLVGSSSPNFGLPLYVTGVIPNGAVYKVAVDFGSPSLSAPDAWMELR